MQQSPSTPFSLVEVRLEEFSLSLHTHSYNFASSKAVSSVLGEGSVTTNVVLYSMLNLKMSSTRTTWPLGWLL